MKKEDMLASFAGNLQESIGAFRKAGPPSAGAGVRRAIPADQVGRERARDVWTIEVDRITPDPDQPRKEFDAEALERLAESLRTRGQFQPIQVRWSAAVERFVIIMGERRWRAAQLAGMTAMACVVREGDLAAGEKLSIQLIENCLREDLSPIEQAKAFRVLMDREGWPQERLAAELAITQPAVAKALSLLKLPEEVQERVEQGAVPQSHAYHLAKLDDPAEQIRLAKAVESQGLTRDDVAKQVRRSAPPKKKAAGRKLPSARVWRSNGIRVELSRKSGLDAPAALAALRDVVSQLEAELAEAVPEAA